jgi:hypothetical protein
MVNLNSKEQALVLAGLRMLQGHLNSGDFINGSIRDILEAGDADNTTPAEIDRLCEQINVTESDRTAGFPFATPISIQDERFLVAADCELIIEAAAYDPGELEAIVKAVNGHCPLLTALEDCRDRLNDWADIQSKGDEREEDAETIEVADVLLREFGRRQ